MSHHYSGPALGFPHGDARLDLTDLYAFGKPGDDRKSILIIAGGRVPAVDQYRDLGAAPMNLWRSPTTRRRVEGHSGGRSRSLQLANPKTAIFYASMFAAILPASSPLWMLLVCRLSHSATSSSGTRSLLSPCRPGRSGEAGPVVRIPDGPADAARARPCRGNPRWQAPTHDGVAAADTWATH